MTQHPETNLSNATLIAELSARLARSAGAEEDWVAAYERGEVLRTDEAALIADVSVDTLRRYCSHAADVGQPLGVCIAGAVWLVSVRRLLADIERRKGHHARLVAEERAAKLQKSRSSPLKTSALRAGGGGGRV